MVQKSAAKCALKPTQVDGDGAGWLIVDDLVDTGETARAVRPCCPKPISPVSTPSRPAGRWSTPSSPKYPRIPGFTPWDTEPRPSRRLSAADLWGHVGAVGQCREARRIDNRHLAIATGNQAVGTQAGDRAANGFDGQTKVIAISSRPIGRRIGDGGRPRARCFSAKAMRNKATCSIARRRPSNTIWSSAARKSALMR